MRSSRLAIALALLLPATAQAEGGLRVTPSKLDVRVQRGDVLPTVRVLNRSSKPMRVDAAAVRSGQELSGLPDYEVTAAAQRAGRRFLAVSPRRFRLAPGQARRVRARVVGGATRGRGAYGVVLVRGVAAGTGGDAVVGAALRISANVMLTFPGKSAPRGPITDLRAEQAGPKLLRFPVQVTNRGTIHGVPTGEVTVRDARGDVVARREIGDGNVLPGYAREYPVTVDERLPAGEYTVRAVTRLGKQRSVRTLRFTLTGTNVLPTPELRISGLEPPQAEAGEVFDVAATVRNAGSAPAPVRAVVRVDDLERVVGAKTLEPDAETTLRTRFAGVREGAHRVTVELRDGDRVIAERTVAFTTGAAPGLWERVLDWLGAHLPLVLGAGLGLGLALALVAVARIRALRRRLSAVAALVDDAANRPPQWEASVADAPEGSRAPVRRRDGVPRP